MNRIKNGLGFNQGYTLKVWKDGVHIANAEETFHGSKSITFQNASGSTSQNTEIASAVMLSQPKEEDGHKLKQWLVKSDYESRIPFYQTNSMSVLYAFRIYNLGQKRKAQEARQNPPQLAENVFTEDPDGLKLAGSVQQHGTEGLIHA